MASFVSVRKRLGGILSQPPGDRDSSVAIYHEGIMGVVDHPRELHLENAVELLCDTVNIEPVVWHGFLTLPASAWPPPAAREGATTAAPGLLRARLEAGQDAWRQLGPGRQHHLELDQRSHFALA